MKRLVEHLRSKLSQHKFISQILVLFSGSFISQLIMMVLTIVILKRYSPEEMGLFGIYTAIAGIPLAIASLRYDMAVMLPSSDVEAKQLFRLSARILIISSALTSLICTLGAERIAAHYKTPALIPWMPYTGLSVLSLGGIVLLGYWFNRRQEYAPIATNRIIQSTSTASSQIALSYTPMAGPSGLIVGTLIGQYLAIAVLLRRAKSLFSLKTDDAPSLKTLMKRYRKMPLLNGPNAVIDAIRDNGITLLIGSIALGEAGYYATSQRFLAIPIALINGAISQVFFQKLTEITPGNMRRFVSQAVQRATLIGIAPFALLWLVAPWVFVNVISPDWEAAGYMVRALIPWLFMTLITSPISTLFVVAERQGITLIFAVFYTVIPLTILWLNPWDFQTTLSVMAWSMGALLVILVFLSLYVAKDFDKREASTPEDAVPHLNDEAALQY